jgi:hypothetical protein|tara:strand:+ start:2999 stop:3196 length:198 start_codon:yes stop_codon:yes gene_type:complete
MKKKKKKTVKEVAKAVPHFLFPAASNIRNIIDAAKSKPKKKKPTVRQIVQSEQRKQSKKPKKKKK